LKLREQLSFGFGVFAATLLVAVLFPLGVLLSREHLDSLRTEVLHSGEAAANAWQHEGVASLQSRFAPVGKIAVWALNGRGVPLAPPSQPDAFASGRAPEVTSALNGVSQSVVRRVDGESRLFAALPVVLNGDVEGVVWLSAPLRPVTQLNNRTWEVLGTVGAIVLVLAVVSGWALARRLSRRLGNLADAAHRLGDDLSTQLPVHGRDEVAELAEALNVMASRIRATLERQTEFVAAASHQLRTPLTAIRLRVDEIRSLGPDDPLSAEYLDEMGDQVERLERLSIQLLGLLSADTTHTQSSVPVDGAVADAIQSVAPLAHRRGVRIDVKTKDPDAHVNAPAGALEQVLLNLIDNAVKYTTSYVVVDVSRANGSIEITVADDGPGVGAEARSRAFDAFYKGPATGPGFGLGLAIAKRISDASSAAVTLEDGEGGGTLARVRWPAH